MKALMIAASVLLAAVTAVPSPVADDAQLVRAWRTQIRASLPGIVDVMGLARVDDLLIVEDDRKGLTALNLADGRLRWMRTLPSPLRHPPAGFGGELAMTTTNHVTVVAQQSGRPSFDERISLVPSATPAVSGDAIIVPSYASSGLVALSARNGREAWTLRLPGDVVGPPVVTPEGQVVVALDDGTLRAVQGRLQKPVGETWTRRVDDIVGRLVLDGSSLYVSTRTANVHRLDGNSGVKIWTDRPGVAVTTPPIVSASHNAVVFGVMGGLRALNASDGTERWQVDEAEWPVGIVAPGAVLVRRTDGTSALRDLSDGSLILEGLSSALLPCGDVLVEWGNDEAVHAYRLAR